MTRPPSKLECVVVKDIYCQEERGVKECVYE